MFATVSVKLTGTALTALLAHGEYSDSPDQLSDAIAEAVDFWLAHREESPCGGADPQAGLRGYQWKSLFLPDGTVLRSWSYGEHRYARVEGDRLIYQGQAVSPNQFARSFARTTRNAWTDLSVRRPGDKTFRLASLLRRQLAREPEPQPQPATAQGPAPTRRDQSPEKGWSLPERRSMRYRLEDVAFD